MFGGSRVSGSVKLWMWVHEHTHVLRWMDLCQIRMNKKRFRIELKEEQVLLNSVEEWTFNV